MTFVELLIGMMCTAFLLTVVLAAALFLGRSGTRFAHYNDMQTEARGTLERFAQDVRQASDLTWVSATEVTLVVNSANITYAYDAGAQTFSRTAGGSTETVMTGVAAFAFTGYKITGVEVDLADLEQASRETKLLQLSMRAERKSVTTALATDNVLSARFILRNKRVTA